MVYRAFFGEGATFRDPSEEAVKKGEGPVNAVEADLLVRSRRESLTTSRIRSSIFCVFLVCGRCAL